MAHQKVSIVIPVYNERTTIEQVLQQVRAADVLGLEKEIILVDDKSTDGTTEFLQKSSDPDLKIIFRDINQGKGAALHAGFAAASGDIIVIQDADLEYDPAEIKKVLKPILANGEKIVYGSRYLVPSTHLNFWHSFFNKFFTRIANILVSQKITDIMTCYKAFDRKSLQKVLTSLQSKRFGFEPEITAKASRAGFRIAEVPISYQPRTKTEGKHMNFKGQLESLWALLKYSFL
jgi:glycosyltransferase involved in cell wall biosynthesis